MSIGDRLLRTLSIVTVVLVAPFTAQRGFAMTAQNFRCCLLTLNNTTCTLDPGTYYITNSTTLSPLGEPAEDAGLYHQPFDVKGTGLIITGTLSGSNLATTLTRYDTTTPSLMYFEGSVASTTVENFIFNGNNYLWGTGSVPPLNCSAPYPNPHCANGFYDLNLTGARPSSQYAILVTDCDFQAAPNYALIAADDTAVTYSSFYWAFTGAMISYNISGTGVYEDYFSATGGGAVSLNGTTTASVQWNQFWDNHSLCGDGNPGGQVYADPGSSNVTINNNWIDGGGYKARGCVSTGIEIYGSNDSILSNQIRSRLVWYHGERCFVASDRQRARLCG
ncbi:MAG: right-handed parallel beta-helix repeat-containing protein [Bryobacteraceae bacterium]|jgi:hypothetical protein